MESTSTFTVQEIPILYLSLWMSRRELTAEAAQGSECVAFVIPFRFRPCC